MLTYLVTADTPEKITHRKPNKQEYEGFLLGFSKE
jgi:hypothetical protein